MSHDNDFVSFHFMEPKCYENANRLRQNDNLSLEYIEYDRMIKLWHFK